MTQTVKTTTKRHHLMQMLLQASVLAVLVCLPTLARADDEVDPDSVSTADLEMSDTAGTELNVPYAEPAQPVSGVKPAAPTPAQSLVEASLAAAGVRPGSEAAPTSAPASVPVPTPKARPAIVPPKPAAAAAPRPLKAVAPVAKAMPAPTTAPTPAPTSTPPHFVPQEASATRALEVGDYVHVRMTTKAATPDLDTVVQVDTAGQVTLPYIGKVKLGGLFLPVAAETLTLRYADGFYVNPQVSLVLMQPASSSDPVSKGTAP